ncbi:hypothetical protein BBI01_06650 [Chryseobacterium artocarpi]|uniref:Toprim domain-containing protein n=1 Tax=Chryseobacterium artocarpi TaxID=1414727 RepID=A0A1B8ZXN5_9FLAO|nr:toprim domain-containing protein [Chryseobacterium artocarpi]OCA76367.1 hypothetical protein BBI01_06650 [Chryseobacterium artocarpi]
MSSRIYPFIKEIWFTIKDKPYYAIGFENRSGGWELRNPYYKGALLNKDISIIHIGTAVQNAGNQELHPERVLPLHPDGRLDNKVVVLEGFLDALSFLELKGSYQGDLLVLNSTSLLKKAIDILKGYTEINLFLDNDKAGKKSNNTILNVYPHAKDFSHIYSDYKDLNQYLMKKRQRQALPKPKTEGIAQQKNDSAEKRAPCKDVKNKATKGLRRRM